MDLRGRSHDPVITVPADLIALCTCGETHYCPEDDNPCVVCADLDRSSPCPVVGYGCGNWAGQSDCDCCTPEQREAATP